MITLNTNLASLIVQSNLQKSTNSLNTAIERMTSGYKVNGAKDNAANYSITTNMTTKIGAYQVAEDNVAMGLDLISTASENLDLIGDKLSRLRALAEQSANGTYGADSRKAIKSEANSLVDEIERLMRTTEYNDKKLFGEQSNFIQNVTRTDTSGLTKLSSVSTSTPISSGTYSISTADELAQLATMTNDGKVTGGTFVLANDIDLSGYSSGEGWTLIGNYSKSFKATFDGNGYVISNLYINRLESGQGLFGFVGSGSIKNLGLENVDVTGRGYVGSLVGDGGTMTNCYVTGKMTAYMELNGSGRAIAGGLVGSTTRSITSCYAICDVTSEGVAGGLVGCSYSSITNSYSTGDVTGNHSVGGLVGNSYSSITNSYATGDVTGRDNVGGLLGENSSCSVTNSYAIGKVTGVTKVGDLCGGNSPSGNTLNLSNGVPFTYETDHTPTAVNSNFQVGINSSDYSSIDLNTVFGINVSSLRSVGSSRNQLARIDELIGKVNTKQTEFGAAQNRLESALEEISTQYDNLVSSRSTLRDADMSEVSSEYIRQQILQQASATLLSTANQSPSFALQLI